MKNRLAKKVVTAATLLGVIAGMTGCGQAETVNAAPAAGGETATAGQAQTGGDPQTAQPAEGVTKIVYAYRNTGNWPVSGDDANGNPDGYDIRVLKEVDALLENYEFEYVGTSYDDAYIGVEAGTYQAALTNAFWTEARAEKYLIPEQNLGASVLILVKTAEHPEIKNLHDLSESGLQLAPLLAGNGMYYVVKQYNDENPDAQVTITPTDDSTFVAGSVEELVAGRYDAVIETKPAFESKVISEDGELHSLIDQISYSEFTLAKTYPMFSKSVGEDFLREFNAALTEVVNSGKASEISQEYFGYDLWNYDFQ